jgi:hypothetical protein
MPLTVPGGSGGTGSIPGPLAFYGATPIDRPAGYSWAYTDKAKSLPSYTANVQGSAYSGGLLDLLQAARLTDLNTLRVAVENQRVLTENLAKQYNQLCQDLIALGLIGQ